jgi:hypothetical protein
VKVIEEQTAYIALLQKQLQRPGSAPGA